jgi:hypothetical protein
MSPQRPRFVKILLPIAEALRTQRHAAHFSCVSVAVESNEQRRCPPGSLLSLANVLLSVTSVIPHEVDVNEKEMVSVHYRVEPRELIVVAPSCRCKRRRPIQKGYFRSCRGGNNRHPKDAKTTRNGHADNLEASTDRRAVVTTTTAEVTERIRRGKP